MAIDNIKTSKPVFTFHELKPSSLFSNLGEKPLQTIWNVGSVAEMGRGEVWEEGKNPCGFVNVVLRGQVSVRRASDPNENSGSLGQGTVFGPVDSVLGRNPFQSALAMEPCFIFVLSREDVAKLFTIVPEFHQHISMMRCSTAVSLAQEYQNKLQAQEKSESDPKKIDLRVVPRLSVWERNVSISLPDKTVLKVDNISASGLGIMGASPVPLQTEIDFTFEGAPFGVSPLPMKGKVSRLGQNSFGLRLLDLPPETRVIWEEIVFRAMNVEISSPFRGTMKKLHTPLEVHFEALGFISFGHMNSLGVSGGILEPEEPIATDRITIMLSLKMPMGEIKTLQIPSKVLERQDQGYLLEFITLSENARTSIEMFLALAKTPSSEGKKDSVATKSEPELEALVRIDNGWVLCMKYFQELREKIVTIPKQESFQVGDKIKVLMEVTDSKVITQKKSSCFELSGRVCRFSSGTTIVKLEEDSASEMALVRASVERFGRDQFDEEFQPKRVFDEASLKKARRNQFVLLILLLASCILWVSTFLSKNDLQWLLPQNWK